MRVGVTGAYGYVGALVCATLAERGHEVVAFARRKRSGGGPGQSEWRGFALERPPLATELRDLDVLIHGAWDLRLASERDVWRVNVEGTRELIRNAVEARVRRIIFVSSMSAYQGTRQLYGRAKLECERLVSDAGGVSVRLGLVYGPGWGGTAGALRKLTALPITPLIGSRSHQFTVHEADMATAIARIAESDVPLPRPVGIAHGEPVPFLRLMKEIAASQGRAYRPLPVPWRLVAGVLMAAEALRIPLGFRSDSVLGLVRPAGSVPERERLNELGIALRRFSLRSVPGEIHSRA